MTASKTPCVAGVDTALFAADGVRKALIHLGLSHRNPETPRKNAALFICISLYYESDKEGLS